MFNCPSCLAGYLRAVAPDAAVPAKRLRSAYYFTADPTRWQRNYASVVTAQQPGKKAPKPHGTALNQVNKASKQNRPILKQTNLRKELERLGDPLKLSENTRRLLEQDNDEKALELVQLAGRTMACTVSWNHIIDYYMSKGKINTAWKLFNDMKKRGQKPDAYTFTILLRGLAENAGFPTALEKALAAYHSMFATNSPVTPNLAHTNALLQVCSRAKDIDTMFDIAAKLPAKGRGAADGYTFTTIINAIRMAALDQSGDPEPNIQRRQQAITQGKRIWADVVARWTEGSLLVDENLVCAMGRLLLINDSFEKSTQREKEDVDDVLSLVQQVMGIPREFPARNWQNDAFVGKETGSVATESGLVSSVAHEAYDLDLMRQLDHGDLDRPEQDNPNAEIEVTNHMLVDRAELTSELSSVFDPIALKDSEPRQYARPGNNALSMILVACSSLHAFHAGSRYWNKLQTVVKPDRENYHAYLRLLRVQRASRQSLDVLKKMILPPSDGGCGLGAESKTFRIAISACSRDHKSPHALSTALQIIHLMRQNLETPDLPTVERFLSLLQARGREADVRKALGAVEVLEGIFNDMRNVYTYGTFDGTAARRTDGSQRSDHTLEVLPGSREGKLTWKSMELILSFSKKVEGAISRAIDYYSEEMESSTRVRWYGKLQTIRAWRKKEEGKAHRRRHSGSQEVHEHDTKELKEAVSL